MDLIKFILPLNRYEPSQKIIEFEKMDESTKAELFVNDNWSPKNRRLMPGLESISNDSNSPTKQNVLQKLVLDMNKAYEKMHRETEEEDFFSDITVVAKGKKEFKAHSYILAGKIFIAIQYIITIHNIFYEF